MTCHGQYVYGTSCKTHFLNPRTTFRTEFLELCISKFCVKFGGFFFLCLFDFRKFSVLGFVLNAGAALARTPHTLGNHSGVVRETILGGTTASSFSGVSAKSFSNRARRRRSTSTEFELFEYRPCRRRPLPSVRPAAYPYPVRCVVRARPSRRTRYVLCESYTRGN